MPRESGLRITSRQPAFEERTLELGKDTPGACGLAGRRSDGATRAFNVRALLRCTQPGNKQQHAHLAFTGRADRALL